jgi:HAD superfamily hydrolase (TIGR01509 family)
VQLRHIIFDCDGVLVDSEPLSMRADVDILARHGIIMTEEEAHHRFVGKTFQGMLDELTGELGVDFPPDLSAAKDALVAKMFHDELKVVPGVPECLEALAANGLSFSVASNSPSSRVQLALQLTGIDKHFTSISTINDVMNGKPAPDVFLKATLRSGFQASECIAIEDSHTGVTAAVAANLRTIGFVGVHPQFEDQSRRLKSHGATPILHQMADLPAALAKL